MKTAIVIFSFLLLFGCAEKEVHGVQGRHDQRRVPARLVRVSDGDESVSRSFSGAAATGNIYSGISLASEREEAQKIGLRCMEAKGYKVMEKK